MAHHSMTNEKAFEAFKSRLSQAINSQGTNPKALARRAGIGETVVRDVLAPGSKDIKLGTIEKLAVALGVPLGVLLPASINSASALHGEYSSPPAGAALDDLAAEHGLAFVEEIDLSLGMGATFLDGGQPEVLGIVPFKESWLHGLHEGPIERLKVVRGKGDSMEPTIRDGDTVLVDTSHRRIDDQDRIWAIAYGELGMIRRIRVTPRGTWMLMPDNQVVRPDEVTDGEAAVIGRVIWIGRRI